MTDLGPMQASSQVPLVLVVVAQLAHLAHQEAQHLCRALRANIRKLHRMVFVRDVRPDTTVLALQYQKRCAMPATTAV